MAYIFTIIFMAKLVSNLHKIFLCIAWHQKPTLCSEQALRAYCSNIYTVIAGFEKFVTVNQRPAFFVAHLPVVV